MVTPTTHATLLQRLRSGNDQVAWRDFADRYGLLIRNVARRHGLQDADCDEIVQDVLISLARAMPAFRYDPARGRFRGYLKTVVVHSVFQRLRQKRSEASIETIAGTADDAGAEQVWDDEWRQYHLRLAMHTIRHEFNDSDCAAFDRYAVRGEDAKATADMLGMTLDQVYQAKSRILKRLTDIVAQQVSDEG